MWQGLIAQVCCYPTCAQCASLRHCSPGSWLPGWKRGSCHVSSTPCVIFWRARERYIMQNPPRNCMDANCTNGFVLRRRTDVVGCSPVVKTSSRRAVRSEEGPGEQPEPTSLSGWEGHSLSVGACSAHVWQQ